MQTSHHDLCVAIRRALVLACEALAEVHGKNPNDLYKELIAAELEKVHQLTPTQKIHEQQQLDKLEQKYYGKNQTREGLSSM